MDSNINNNQDTEPNNNFNDGQMNAQNTVQNDYYNNDAYYNNENYNSNYSDTTYEEPERKSGIWWKILLGILVLLIIVVLLLKFCTGGKTGDEKHAELKTRLCTAAEKYAADNEGVIDETKPGTSVTIKVQKLADAKLVETQIENPYYKRSLFGKSDEEKYYSLNNSVRLTVLNDGSFFCEMVDNSKDVTAPELRLTGDATITIAVGTEFTDPGYTATDDYDGDITSRVVRSGNVDISKAGEYIITYSVSDSAGNDTHKTRKVVVEEYADIEITLGTILDSVTPMISLKGSNPYCMVKGTKYVEPGAVATDNVDGDITNNISVTNKITGNLMGAFRVTYKVEDSSGNQAIAYRAVIVTTECPSDNDGGLVANNAPVITLIGKTSVTISKGTEYLDLGATAYDKEDGDITSQIITDTTGVNTKVAGVYKVNYRVTDSVGKLATATRIVTVKEDVTGTPSVRFTGTKSNIEVEVGKGTDSLISAPKAVNEKGVEVSVSMAIENYVTKAKVSSINWNSVGKYRVTYTAVHNNGNIRQTKSITVTIYDNGVTIGGKDKINVAKRDKNCDLTEADLLAGGVTFTASGNQTPIVLVNAPDRMVCTLGTYETTVSATTTSSGTTTKKITVTVIDGNSTLDPTAPSKVVITGNSATVNDVYNTKGIWVGGTVTGITLTFSATPAANTELAYFEVSSNCSSDYTQASKTSPTSGTFTWTVEGKNSVCVRAVTTANSKGPWSDPVKVYIDKTGPAVEFTHTWKDESEDWHNDPTLTLSYKATDSGSGLDHFEYTYDDVKAKKAEEITTYNEASGKLTVNENTESARHKLFVYVRAVDKAGNVGKWTENPAYANIDTIKPYTPTLEVSGNGTSTVKIKANFSDAPSIRPSGFGSLLYKENDGADKTEKTQTITATPNTTTENVSMNLKVWAVDKAGNKSDNYGETDITLAPAKVLVTGIKLMNGETEIMDGANCSNSTVYPQGVVTLTATPIPADAEDKVVTWSTNNPNVAVVDENGKIVAKNPGETEINVKIGTVSKTCKIKVDKSTTSSSSSSSSSNGTNGTPKPDPIPTTPVGACCCNGSSQGCNYKWDSTGSCAGGAKTDKSESNCYGSSTSTGSGACWLCDGVRTWSKEGAAPKSSCSLVSGTPEGNCKGTTQTYSYIEYTKTCSSYSYNTKTTGSCTCSVSSSSSANGTCSGTTCKCPTGYSVYRSNCSSTPKSCSCKGLSSNTAGTCTSSGCKCSKGEVSKSSCSTTTVGKQCDKYGSETSRKVTSCTATITSDKIVRCEKI